jgi:DNA-binding transcriptional ArsR family regulator
MVVGELDDERTNLLFHALADRTRRDIVTTVMGREFSVSELARRYPMSFAAVQKHVAVLERAGLVGKHQRGREQLVRGRVDTLHVAHALLDQFEAMWRDRLDRFDTVLEEQEGTPT